jgi:hypothetical protein
MSGHAWAEVVGAAGIFIFATTVVTVVIVQVFATWRARATLAREAEFRQLAMAAIAAQESIDHRLAAIERILKQVE